MPDPYSPDDNATFRMALIAYWQSSPGLVAISGAPYADRAPAGLPEDASYCVLSQVSATDSERGSRGRAFRQDIYYQFAVYHRDQAQAILSGEAMASILDRIQDFPLRFASGYQRGWWHQSERLMEVPEVIKAGARTIWQQSHIYKATLGRGRRG